MSIPTGSDPLQTYNHVERARPARTNLYEELYDTAIDDQGNRAIWEQAAVCSCVSRDSGQPNFMCPICNGRGYRYLPPQEIIAAVTSLNGNFKLGTLELYEPGTAYCTPMSNVIMGYQDRLTWPDFTCKFSEVIRFDSTEWGMGVSRQTYRKIHKIVSLTDTQHEYEEGVDVEVSEDGYHIKCLTPEIAQMLDGKNLSLLYLTYPSYLVVDVLHELRGTRSDRIINAQKQKPGVTYRELPKQYRLQREQFTYGVSTPDPVEIPRDSGEGETV